MGSCKVLQIETLKVLQKGVGKVVQIGMLRMFQMGEGKMLQMEALKAPSTPAPFSHISPEVSTGLQFLQITERKRPEAQTQQLTWLAPHAL